MGRAPGESRTFCFGVLSSHAGHVGSGLPADVVERWDRWFELASRSRPPEPGGERPVWRFVARAGLFGPDPVAGVWRLSRDRVGRIYPFLVASLGTTPAPGDAWFDGAARLVGAVTDEGRLVPGFDARLAALPAPLPAPPPDGAILVWRDDWEVHELAFPDGRTLAAFGVPGAA